MAVTATANLLQAYGQQRVGAAEAAVIYTMDPVYGALFAWLLLGERLHTQGPCIHARACAHTHARTHARTHTRTQPHTHIHLYTRRISDASNPSEIGRSAMETIAEDERDQEGAFS